jgi:hypothetical protein
MSNACESRGHFRNEIVSGVGGRQILLEDPVAALRIDLITLP